jgi:hypothetical protein
MQKIGYGCHVVEQVAKATERGETGAKRRWGAHLHAKGSMEPTTAAMLGSKGLLRPVG